MTRLRVLSGLHAGVSIDWDPDRLRVGANEDLDVYIGDWNAQQIELRRDDAGRAWIHWDAADDAVSVPGQRREGDQWVCALEPWMPLRFGRIILCIGPSDADWPDDADLLSRCFAPPEPEPVPDPAISGRAVGRGGVPLGRRIVIVAMAAGMLAAVPSSVLQSSRVGPAAGPMAATHARAPQPGASAARVASMAPAASAAPTEEPVASSSMRLQALLDIRGFRALDVRDRGGRLVVTGVLPSRAAVDDLNRLLDAQAAPVKIGRSFISAPDLVDWLYQVMPEGGMTVRQTAARAFVVTGRVNDPDRANAVLTQAAADLAGFGARVELALASRQDPLPAMSGLLIDGRGMSILRTRDGVKHIVVAGRPAAPATAAAAASTFNADASAQEQNHDTR